MNNITFYARLVKIISYILMPIIIINFFIKWLFPEMIFANSFIGGFSYDQSINPTIITMPLAHRLMAMIVDGISASLLIMILFLIIVIMQRIQQREIFSASIAHSFSKISKLAFAFAIYTPISQSLLSVITTLQNAPGQRILSISFGSAELFNIFIFGFFMVITLLIQQGTSLQNEQNLTV